MKAAVTRWFLERLSEDKLAWKPHQKSFTVGQLAYHLATVLGDVVKLVVSDTKQAGNFVFPQPASAGEILTALDHSTATVREVLPGFDDAAMQCIWRLMAGNQELLAVPRGAFLRDIMLSHWYQLRGQFSVYLRLLDVPVPSSWGPSADEPPASTQKPRQ
jgi:uncharacterized damage-inducible protein DinB